MAGLTEERDTPTQHEDYAINYPQATNTKIWNGALVMLSATGFAEPAADTASCTVVGRAQTTADSTVTNTITPGVTLADGVSDVDALQGVFQYDNPTGAHQLVQADVGLPAYVLSDHEVQETGGTVHGIVAGVVVSVDTTNNKATIDTRRKS